MMSLLTAHQRFCGTPLGLPNFTLRRRWLVWATSDDISKRSSFTHNRYQPPRFPDGKPALSYTLPNCVLAGDLVPESALQPRISTSRIKSMRNSSSALAEIWRPDCRHRRHLSYLRGESKAEPQQPSWQALFETMVTLLSRDLGACACLHAAFRHDVSTSAGQLSAAV